MLKIFSGGGAQASASGVPTGGTTGQVLAKNSNTNGDAGWVTPAAPGNETPLANSGTGTPGVGLDYSRDDHQHPASAGVSSVLGTRIFVSSKLIAGTTYIAPPPSPNSLFTSTPKGQMNLFPVVFTQAFNAKLAFRLNGAGSSDISTTVAVWNANADGTSRPGTLLGSFTVATGAAGAATYVDTTIHSFQAGVTYWFANYCTGTTAPQGIGCYPQEKLQADFAGGNDNNPWYTNTWRYAVSLADLSATLPQTGDGMTSAPFVLLQAA